MMYESATNHCFLPHLAVHSHSKIVYLLLPQNVVVLIRSLWVHRSVCLFHFQCPYSKVFVVAVASLLCLLSLYSIAYQKTFYPLRRSLPPPSTARSGNLFVSVSVWSLSKLELQQRQKVQYLAHPYPQRMLSMRLQRPRIAQLLFAALQTCSKSSATNIHNMFGSISATTCNHLQPLFLSAVEHSETAGVTLSISGYKRTVQSEQKRQKLT
mmetsp:Transcript_19866/g.39805  ORF Transcript_19866/g.39805 Transcript_19866/m.39805 type:complete len:211 (-) Transcript_19866:576-1208(-)